MPLIGPCRLIVDLNISFYVRLLVVDKRESKKSTLSHIERESSVPIGKKAFKNNASGLPYK